MKSLIPLIKIVGCKCLPRCRCPTKCSLCCPDNKDTYFVRFLARRMPDFNTPRRYRHVSPDSEQNDLLLGQAMECAGMIGEAVGRTRFKSDGLAMMSTLMVRNFFPSVRNATSACLRFAGWRISGACSAA